MRTARALTSQLLVVLALLPALHSTTQRPRRVDLVSSPPPPANTMGAVDDGAHPMPARLTELDGAGAASPASPRCSMYALPPRSGRPELFIARWPLEGGEPARPGTRCPGPARPPRAPPELLTAS